MGASSEPGVNRTACGCHFDLCVVCLLAVAYDTYFQSCVIGGACVYMCVCVCVCVCLCGCMYGVWYRCVNNYF
jgi:hypothetical protein